MLESTLDMAKQKWEKDQAIFKQKQEFLELQLREERSNNEQQKSNFETMLRNLQMRERDSVIGKEEASRRIQEIKEQHGQEYHELEGKYDSVRRRMQEQIDQLTERNQELDMSLKIHIEDFQRENGQLREQLHSSDEQKNKALETIKNLDTQKIRMMEESEERSKLKLFDLERELEDKTHEFEEAMKEMQSKSEEQLA